MIPPARAPARSRAARAAFRLVGIVRIPEQTPSPARAIGLRISYALAALAAAVLVVYLGRDGYTDAADGKVSLLDCAYYATVSLSTTGYGDIAPITDEARLVNTFVVTPLRVFFLIVLVGTTLSALTESSRQTFRIQRWRHRVHDHTVIIGYGTKGRAAAQVLLAAGIHPASIVAIDPNPLAIDAAASQGLVTLHGSATADTLRLACLPRSRSVIIATDRDDTTVLATLTARRLAPRATITVAARESENTGLLHQAGANSVLTSSETAGRLLGSATHHPHTVQLVEDLLTPDSGFTLAQRPPHPHEIGHDPRTLPDLVVSIVRDQHPHPLDTPSTHTIRPGDQFVYLRRIAEPSTSTPPRRSRA